MSSAWKFEGSDPVVAEEQHESENPFSSFAFGGTTTAVSASAPRPSTGDKRKNDTGE